MLRPTCRWTDPTLNFRAALTAIALVQAAMLGADGPVQPVPLQPSYSTSLTASNNANDYSNLHQFHTAMQILSKEQPDSFSLNTGLVRLLSHLVYIFNNKTS